MKVVPGAPNEVPAALPKAGRGKAAAQAFIVGVGKDRKAPGLKAFGLEKDPTALAVLGNKDIALPFKATRTLLTPAGWLVLVGTGDAKALTQEKVGTLANLGCRAAGGVGCRVAATTLVLDTWRDAAAAQAVAHGAVIGSLDFDQWKSKPAEYKPADTKPREMKQEPPTPPVKLETLQVLLPAGAAGKAAAKAIERASIAAAAVNDSRLLSNTPANIATPVWLANEAILRGKQHGFKVTTKDRATLRKEGFHALCGVAQGSVNEERLITMVYDPSPSTGGAKGKGKGAR